MNSNNQKQLDWEDLEYVAVLGEMNEAAIQCAIIHEGHQLAHLFLLKDGLLALTEVNLEQEGEPTDELLLAIARVQVEHLRACREGRSLI
jgi:hypothetical protein